MFLIGMRVANYRGSGEGHINRCIVIRKYLEHRIIWFLDKPEKKIFNFFPRDKVHIEKSKEEIDKSIELCKKKYISMMLIDSYAIKKNILEKLNKTVITSVILDSYENINANILISPQPITFKKVKNIRYFIGPKFAPVDLKKSTISKEKTFLVSMGMYDSKGVTLKIINVIKKNYKKKIFNFNTIITLGKKSPILKQVKEEIKKYKDNIQLIIEAENMNSIYEKCQFAIGAPGLSYLERLAVGVPSILISQSKRHDYLIKKWKSKNCAIEAKDNLVSIEKAILQMETNKKLRQNIRQQGLKNVDGKGALRIANEITRYLINYKA